MRQQATRRWDLESSLRRRALTRGVLYGVAIAVVAWGIPFVLWLVAAG